MIHLLIYKRILGYLYPVLIRRSFSRKNRVLELFFYRGRYQLATLDALYSDGHRYRPLVKAFGKMQDVLPGVKNVLMLGTGLGSAALILNKSRIFPSYTMIDNDETVLQWASELLPVMKDVTLICEDARMYVENEEQNFDLLIIDIFEGREVPAFVTTADFLEKCRRKVAPGGHVIINYIINKDAEWKTAETNINRVFPANVVHRLGINRIIIAKA